jgi:TolB-like protein/Flp pilus assembly protein TadD
VLPPTLGDKLLYQFGNHSLDSERRELRCGSNLAALEPQVFDLLEFLIRNRDRIVSKDDLIATIWHGRAVSDSAVSSRINAARTAVGDSGEEQRLIRTLPRKGFRFVGAVREEAEAESGGSDEARGEPGPVLSLPDSPSIAVLPFSSLSGEPEQDYFADGMAEDITTALARFKWLFVIARNSAFTYKGRVVDIRQVGRELGVRYVLEGSVRRSSNQLRITGQLIDATTGAHIWADRFDGDLGDVFSLQDRITESVVAAIEPTLQRAEIERMKRKPPANLDSYDLLLRAQELEHAFTEASLAEALLCVKDALALDPAYAPAMGLAAYCYSMRRVQGWMKNPRMEIAEGLRLASAAAEIGKDDATVLWRAAFAARQLAVDARRASDLAYRALSLNPNSAMAMAIAGLSETGLGNPEKALELLRRAERLSPRDPNAWLVLQGVGVAYFMLDQFEQSASSARRALLYNPRHASAHRLLTASLVWLGRTEEATAVMRELLTNHPDLTFDSWRDRTPLHDTMAQKLGEALRIAGLPG